MTEDVAALVAEARKDAQWFSEHDVQGVTGETRWGLHIDLLNRLAAALEVSSSTVTPTREALAKLAEEAFTAWWNAPDEEGRDFGGFMADLWQPATPRMVATVEELDALPVGSVIRADSGMVLHRQRADYWTPCDDSADQFTSRGVAGSYRAPYRVLSVGVES